MNQSILEKPLERSGVYVIFNLLKKKVYVGETNDFYYRMIQHLTGIFGDGESTNANLKKEADKAFEIFPAINCDYYKKNRLYKNWEIHETIVMYIFKKYGYSLYNGNQDLQDDKGKKRSFLLGDSNTNDLKNHTLDYLNTISYSDTWENLITETENKLNNTLKEKLFPNEDIQNPLEYIMSITDENQLKEIWAKRLSSVIDKNNIRIVNEKNHESICNELITTYLSLEDLANCGLNKMSVDELIKLISDDKLNKVVFSKFGNYLDQNPMTILSIKSYDLEHNRLGDLELDINPDKKDCTVCFWALDKLNPEHTQAFLSDGHTTKESRYVIMPFTTSKKYSKADFIAINRADLNPQGNETFDDFFKRTRDTFNQSDNDNNFAHSYSDSKIKFDTPENMFPPVILKKSSALLISELSYIDIGYDEIAYIYQHFYSLSDQNSKGTNKEEELAYTYGIKGTQSLHLKDDRCEHKIYYPVSNGKSPTSHTCASLKPEHKQDLINFFSKAKNEKSETTSFIIAKIEYPYIVSLF